MNARMGWVFIVIGMFSAIHLHGLLRKKSWFWEPQKQLKNPFVWNQLWVVPFRYVFGNKGVIIFTVTLHLMIWLSIFFLWQKGIFLK